MWISGYPWGYLPYQCGAWNYYSSFGWGWAPGGYCNPWWGHGGGWAINIGFAPPHYHYPVRPRPRHPRPVGGGHEPTPQPMIAVNRRVTTPGGAIHAPRDKTGTVVIAGSALRPLRPVQDTRLPYNHSGPVFSTRPVANQPVMTGNPRPVSQGGNSNPRPIVVPARPGTIYTPAPTQPRSGSMYTPAPTRPGGGPTYRPPAPTQPVYSHPAPPVRSAPPRLRSAVRLRLRPPSHPVSSGGAHPIGSGGAAPHR